MLILIIFIQLKSFRINGNSSPTTSCSQLYDTNNVNMSYLTAIDLNYTNSFPSYDWSCISSTTTSNTTLSSSSSLNNKRQHLLTAQIYDLSNVVAFKMSISQINISSLTSCLAYANKVKR